MGRSWRRAEAGSVTGRAPQVCRRLLGAALALAVCVGLAWKAAASVPVQAPLSAEGARVYWRWIGILDDPQEGCDPPGGLPAGWISGRLFSPAAASRFPALEPFCVYEFHGGGSAPLADRLFIDTLDGTVDHTTLHGPVATGAPRILSAVAPDLLAVTSQGMLDVALRPRLAALFDEQAGRFPTPPPQPPAQVRLALIDTSPTGSGGGAEKSVHGHSLRRMAERLLCESGTCVAEVRTRLALAFETFDAFSRVASLRNEQEGGLVGLVSELGAAVVEEVDAWRAGSPAAFDRLVLNLSVAWDRLYGGGDLNAAPETFSPPVQAVYRALESIACDGKVLAVVAAGNLSDRHAANSLTGPLLPAAWRERAADCGPMQAAPPLVVAVAGVDRQLVPLGNAIPQSLPEIVAYGDHGAVDDSGIPGAPTAVLTGSSVAALVASTTLAAMAAFRPDLGFEALVHLAHDDGETAGGPADICALDQSGPCPEVRGISLCKSVQAACTAPGGNCPQGPPTCSARPHGAPTLPLPELPALPIVVDASWLQAVNGSPCPACGTFDAFSFDSAFPADPCPDRQLHGPGRRPYAHPQPQSSMCPNCGIFFLPALSLAPKVQVGGSGTWRNRLLGLSGGSSSVYVEIDSGGSLEAGVGLTSPALVLHCGPGPPQVYYPDVGTLPVLLQDGDAFLVHGLDADCRSGVITFVLEEGGQATASIRQPLWAARLF